jgi:hypothetical protein
MFGNRVSLLSCELPLACGDPVRVLRTVRRQMRERRAAGQQRPLVALARTLDALPATSGRGPLIRAVAGRIAFTAIVSNVRGPDFPLWLCGCELRSIHPVVPILRGRALTLGAISYNGTIHSCLYGDATVMTDINSLGEDLRRAFATLTAARAAEPTPWQRRAREKRIAS